MLSMLKRHDIQTLVRAGHSFDDVAKRSDVSRRSVARVAKEEPVMHVDDEAARREARVGRPSKVERFRKLVQKCIEEDAGLASVEIFRRSRQEGYDGQKSALYALVKELRPAKLPIVTRFEAVPGEFSQHDFGEVVVRYLDGSSERVVFFATRLKYSRWVQVSLVRNQRAETLVRSCCEHFAAIGGIPLLAVFDRPRTVAVAWKKDGSITQYNPLFAQAMFDMGVGAEICWPHAPQQKGAVENLVGWVKGSFFKVLRFRDRADLEAQLEAWHHEANVERPSRATGVPPAERMAAERARLRPLRVQPHELAVRRPIATRHAHGRADRRLFRASRFAPSRCRGHGPHGRTIMLSADNATLDAALKRLNLAYTRRYWSNAVARAEREQWSYRDFLAVLVSEEIAHRAQTGIERRTRNARFPFLKNNEEFDFTHQSALRQVMLGSYLAPEFAPSGAGLILHGKPGRGKTHLAIAIAYKAILNGHDALFVTAAELIEELSGAADDGRLHEALRRFVAPAVLVIDEVGYLSLRDSAANVLYHVVNRRYLRHKPIVFTTNKPLTDWGDVLHDPDLAPPILDRVLHRGRLLVLDGPSARNPQPITGPQAARSGARISGKVVPELTEPTTGKPRRDRAGQLGRDQMITGWTRGPPRSSGTSAADFAACRAPSSPETRRPEADGTRSEQPHPVWPEPLGIK